MYFTRARRFSVSKMVAAFTGFIVVSVVSTLSCVLYAVLGPGYNYWNVDWNVTRVLELTLTVDNECRLRRLVICTVFTRLLVSRHLVLGVNRS